MEFIQLDLEQLRHEYENDGLSLRALAKKYNTSKITIKRKLNKLGVNVLSSSDFIKKHNKQHVKQSSKRYDYDDDILKLYEEGKSINDIVNEYDLSEYKVRKIITERRKIDKDYISKKFSTIYDKVKPDWINYCNLYKLYHNDKWSITDIANHYGYDAEAIRQAFIKYGIIRRETSEATFLHNKANGYTSGLEKVVKRILDDNNVKNEKFFDCGFEFDLLVNNKLLLEINGLYTHLYDDSKISRDKEKKEHWLKNLSHKYDYEIIWEHQIQSVGSVYDILNNLLQFDKINIDKSLLSFRKISFLDSDLFCKAYHYYGNTRKGDYYGAFYGDILIAVSVYSSVTRKQSADRLNIETNKIRELSRFCINQSYRSHNLASFILSKFERLFKKDNKEVCCLLSFADQTMGHVGTIYKATNWTIDGETKESYYYESNGMKWHKKTIWQHAKNLNIKESELAEMFKLNKINTLKKIRYVKYLV